jgi:hypothetical protein
MIWVIRARYPRVMNPDHGTAGPQSARAATIGLSRRRRPRTAGGSARVAGRGRRVKAIYSLAFGIKGRAQVDGGRV